ncbi:MAG: SRPBCC family protein [Thermoplasmatota archaeon]
MPSFTLSASIRRSPEQVFAVLDDLGEAPRWMPGIRRIDVLTPGMRMGVGFKWRETRRVFGILRMKVVLVVTSHDPPRTWGLTYNDGKVQATATFELDESASGTKVTFFEEVEDLQGKPQRAERLLQVMRKKDGDVLQRLKAHVEATTEEPAGLLPEPQVVEEAESTPAKAGGSKAKARKPAKKAKAGTAKPKTAKGKAAGKRTAGKPK